ncbi:MAG: Rrf2 family transcriptional regulator [Desulfobacterales bacterium]|nr:MAG: Rrf2 family transcriptional regulator [Desulfobacterales bacterium]
MLARRPEDITLGQIVRLFEVHTDLTECVSSPESCDPSIDCKIRMAWKEAAQALYDKLDSTTIADLVG